MKKVSNSALGATVGRLWAKEIWSSLLRTPCVRCSHRIVPDMGNRSEAELQSTCMPKMLKIWGPGDDEPGTC